jgi:uncharacterized protein with GYD domain
LPKYMFKASLTLEGLQGTLSDGGTGRRQAVTAAMEALGGKVEAFYYAFGEPDVFVIVELPDNATAAAAAAAVALTGTSTVETVVLIEPSEIDTAAEIVGRMSEAYRPPGG